MHRVLVALAVLMVGWALLAPARAGRVVNDALVTKPFRHHIWQDVLTSAVTADGDVDFIKLRAQPLRLNQYLDQLGAVSPDSHPDYFPTRRDELAYWLNAHNAVAMRLILDIYPADSLEAYPHLEQTTRYPLGGQVLPLSAIRDRVMMRYGEFPQAVFALTDMTVDAPPLSLRAYEGDKLAEQLENQVQATWRNPRMITFVPGPCLGVAISPFLQRFQGALLATPIEETGEDALNRSLPPEESDALPEAARSQVDLSGWLPLIRPWAPPDVYAELNRDCPHPVSFRDPNRRLRVTP